MSANKYPNPNPEQTSLTTQANEILARSQEQFQRAVENSMTAEEFDQRPSLSRVFYLATNKEAPRDPILVGEESFGMYEVRLLGRVVRKITFVKDEGDVSLGVEVGKELLNGRDAKDSLPTDVTLSRNPDGAFVGGVPVDLAIATEDPLSLAVARDNWPLPRESNILEQFSAVVSDIERAIVFSRKS